MLMRCIRHAAFWIPFAFASYMAFAPNPEIVPPSISDVLQHISAFVYLTIACWHVYYRDASGRAPALWMAAYGIAIEVIQAFEPTRTFEFKDMGVDALGIGIALMCYSAYRRYAIGRMSDVSKGVSNG
jgi:VanZ family protein